ncbi:hypothetical protein LN042_22950 [Kitasatospora sp. RB6PN24]|uniref:hypothetical protein n=1 Tax=Kitasatospora humi TaxID=2893891 RepID=UPI001E309BF2|nr:hypothetical protein [Kitasatospora humi]MCC9309894.1 hypothetical protein [Kitasatospora humi]
MSSNTSTPKTPAQRGAAVRPNGSATMRLRDLRPGDVKLARGGEEAVILTIQSLGRGEYVWTSRVVRPSAEAGSYYAPLYWAFPFTLSAHGHTMVDVAADRHVDPASLPPSPYPDERSIPTQFHTGDVVRHGRVVWTREPQGWFNHARTRFTEPTGDSAIERLFRDPLFLRLAIPEYVPAALVTPPYVLTADSPAVIHLSEDAGHLCAWSGQVDGVWRERHRATAFRLDSNGIPVPVCDEHAPLLTAD